MKHLSAFLRHHHVESGLVGLEASERSYTGRFVAFLPGVITSTSQYSVLIVHRSGTHDAAEIGLPRINPDQNLAHDPLGFTDRGTP